MARLCCNMFVTGFIGKMGRLRKGRLWTCCIKLINRQLYRSLQCIWHQALGLSALLSKGVGVVDLAIGVDPHGLTDARQVDVPTHMSVVSHSGVNRG